jgi:hypothetical protein
VSLLVDTRVWSLALRRDSASGSPAVEALRTALEGGDTLVTTGTSRAHAIRCRHLAFFRDRFTHVLLSVRAGLEIGRE